MNLERETGRRVEPDRGWKTEDGDRSKVDQAPVFDVQLNGRREWIFRKDASKDRHFIRFKGAAYKPKNGGLWDDTVGKDPAHWINVAKFPYIKQL